MNSDYVKQLEETIENLNNKLNDCIIQNEKITDQCKKLEIYSPKFIPHDNGFEVYINKASIARVTENKNRNGDICGYDLLIKDKKVCVVSDLNVGKKMILDWYDTGIPGMPGG